MTAPAPENLATVIRAVTQLVHPSRRWKVGAQASLKDDLQLDALDRLDLACRIDEALGIEIPDADLHAWETVADVVATANRLIPADRPHTSPAQPNWQALGFAGAEDAAGRN